MTQKSCAVGMRNAILGNHLNKILIVYFLLACLFKEVLSWASTIHLGIFHGQALSADSVSPWMNAITSCDQFKPIGITENLVVNYKG